MHKKCKAALAAAAAALCLCALPLAAQAGSWGGTVLSKGLVYEDVYGVVNGNAQMSKKIEENEHEIVYETDLVSSTGAVLFKTGYVQGKLDGDFGVKAHEDFRYMPHEPLFDGRASATGEFGVSHGGMRAIDTTNNKVVVVNAKGKIVLEGCDGAAILVQDQVALGVKHSGDHVDITLVDLQTGDTLDTASGYRGATAVGAVEADSGSATVWLFLHGIQDTTYVTVQNRKLQLHSDPYTADPNTVVYDYLGYTVRFMADKSISITQPSGDVKTIAGPFSSASVLMNDYEHPVIWADEAAGSFRYFTMVGEELFPGKHYDRVERLGDTSAYLCQDYDMDTASYYIDHTDGSERTLIERIQGHDAMYLAFNEFAIRYKHTIVNGYTTQVVTAIVDASGKTLKTYDPGEQWFLGSTKSMTDLGPTQAFNQARLCLYKEDGVSVYLDGNLNPVKTIDGRVELSQVYLVKGEPCYPIITHENERKHHLPNVLCDADLNTIDVQGHQRVVAGGATYHKDILYVTDGKGRYGAYSSSTSEMIVPVQFDSIYDIGTQSSNDTILVQKDGKWYFMDLSGKQPEAPSFGDVDASTPHKDHVAWLAAEGISKGWDNGDGTYSFRPYETVKRCDMAAFLYRLAGEPDFDEGSAPTFSDVDASTPHRRAILWLASKGISKGWDNGDGTYSFRPYETVKRCDMAAFLYRLAGEPELDETTAASFADVVSDTPHREAVLWLAAAGVSTGWVEEDGSRTFRPYYEVARCDMAAFLHRMDENGLVK